MAAGREFVRKISCERAGGEFFACKELHWHECVASRCSILIEIYFSADEEVKAVQVMASAMRQTPQSYTLLHAQCDFLRSKGKFEWALKLARQAVNCAPSEFVTWEKLADLYIDLGQYDSVCFILCC